MVRLKFWKRSRGEDRPSRAAAGGGGDGPASPTSRSYARRFEARDEYGDVHVPSPPVTPRQQLERLARQSEERRRASSTSQGHWGDSTPAGAAGGGAPVPASRAERGTQRPAGRRATRRPDDRDARSRGGSGRSVHRPQSTHSYTPSRKSARQIREKQAESITMCGFLWRMCSRRSSDAERKARRIQEDARRTGSASSRGSSSSFRSDGALVAAFVFFLACWAADVAVERGMLHELTNYLDLGAHELFWGQQAAVPQQGAFGASPGGPHTPSMGPDGAYRADHREVPGSPGDAVHHDARPRQADATPPPVPPPLHDREECSEAVGQGPLRGEPAACDTDDPSCTAPAETARRPFGPQPFRELDKELPLPSVDEVDFSELSPLARKRATQALQEARRRQLERMAASGMSAKGVLEEELRASGAQPAGGHGTAAADGSAGASMPNAANPDCVAGLTRDQLAALRQSVGADGADAFQPTGTADVGIDVDVGDGTGPLSVAISVHDVAALSDAGIVTQAQAGAVWHALLVRAAARNEDLEENGPGLLSVLNVMYLVATGVMTIACVVLVAIFWDQGIAVASVAGGTSVLFYSAGFALLKSDESRAVGGLMLLAPCALAPVALLGLLKAAGIWSFPSPEVALGRARATWRARRAFFADPSGQVTRRRDAASRGARVVLRSSATVICAIDAALVAMPTRLHLLWVTLETSCVLVSLWLLQESQFPILQVPLYVAGTMLCISTSMFMQLHRVAPSWLRPVWLYSASAFSTLCLWIASVALPHELRLGAYVTWAVVSFLALPVVVVNTFVTGGGFALSSEAVLRRAVFDEADDSGGDDDDRVPLSEMYVAFGSRRARDMSAAVYALYHLGLAAVALSIGRWELVPTSVLTVAGATLMLPHSTPWLISFHLPVGLALLNVGLAFGDEVRDPLWLMALQWVHLYERAWMLRIMTFLVRAVTALCGVLSLLHVQYAALVWFLQRMERKASSRGGHDGGDSGVSAGADGLTFALGTALCATLLAIVASEEESTALAVCLEVVSAALFILVAVPYDAQLRQGVRKLLRPNGKAMPYIPGSPWSSESDEQACEVEPVADWRSVDVSGDVRPVSVLVVVAIGCRVITGAASTSTARTVAGMALVFRALAVAHKRSILHGAILSASVVAAAIIWGAPALALAGILGVYNAIVMTVYKLNNKSPAGLALVMVLVGSATVHLMTSFTPWYEGVRSYGLTQLSSVVDTTALPAAMLQPGSGNVEFSIVGELVRPMVAWLRQCAVESSLLTHLVAVLSSHPRAA